jgi:hypothetical protein
MARWCMQLVEALVDVGRRVGRLSEQIAADWPDEHGREWAERSDLLRRELDRAALAAAELGRLLARETTEDGSGAIGPPTARSRTGMRLGETAGARADDERGIRIAELPDQPPPG